MIKFLFNLLRDLRQKYLIGEITPDTKMAEEVNRLLDQYKAMSGQLQELYAKSQQFVQQESENSLVKVELDLLESSANVFKLVGPVLIRQNLDDAKDVCVSILCVWFWF